MEPVADEIFGTAAANKVTDEIDSIFYKEINARFFIVSCTGDADKVITALHLLIREAQCIGGFVPGMILRT